jgi:hypothetical protein
MKYTERKKSYYTDSHQAGSTVGYKNNVYLPEQHRLSLRQAVWVEIPQGTATQDQLEDTRSINWFH